MKIRRRMGETKQIVQVNGGNILLFELAFRLLTLPLLLQAVAALFRLSVRASGYSYVTVSNLVSYLLRPVTLAILVLMAAILQEEQTKEQQSRFLLEPERSRRVRDEENEDTQADG